MDNNLTDIKISVVCPSYNSASFIIKTLESIVLQKVKPFELLISDDGSSDQTCEVVAAFIAEHVEFPIRLIKNTHAGPGACRNSGILNATGNWIAFIDSDDIWLPDKLASVCEVIRKHPTINFICHSIEHHKFDGSRNKIDFGYFYQDKQPLFNQLYKRNLFSTSTVTCKKKLLLEKGLFDPKLMSGQDYELWLRMSFNISPYFIREILSYYIDREGNITSTFLMRRWKNSFLIANKYRSQAGMLIFMKKMVRLSISIAYNKLKGSFGNIFLRRNRLTR